MGSAGIAQDKSNVYNELPVPDMVDVKPCTELLLSS